MLPIILGLMVFLILIFLSISGMAKKKVSAYNRHVKKEMKAGKTMKQAARSWKGKGKTKKKSKSKKSGGKVANKKPKKRGKYKINKKGIVLFGVVNYIFAEPLVSLRNLMAAEDKWTALSEQAVYYKSYKPTAMWLNTALLYKYGDCNLLKKISNKISVNKKSLAITYVSGTSMNYPYIAKRIKNYAFQEDKSDMSQINLIKPQITQNQGFAALQAFGVYKYGSPIKFKGKIL